MARQGNNKMGMNKKTAKGVGTAGATAGAASGGEASSGQQIVGQAGPWGAAISGVSQMATGPLDKSDSPVAGSIAAGIFDPSRNTKSLSDDRFSTGEKALSMALPFAYGFMAKKKDNQVPAQDPLELQRLAELDRIRKSIGAGTDPLTQQAVNQARQTGAATQANLSRVTGGDVGATVAAMTRAQRGTQAATNQAVAGAQQRLPFFEGLASNLRTRVSQRALEVGLLGKAQQNAERAQAAKERAANIGGAMAYLNNRQGLDGFDGSVNKSGTGAINTEGGMSTVLNSDVSGVAGAPPGGFWRNGANQQIPTQQAPLTSPGIVQVQNAGTIVSQGNQQVIDNLANTIRSNPSGAPSEEQLGLMNKLNN